MKTESGPLCLRKSSILALISLSAWSQPMRTYLPSTSFIGYFSRNSPWPCSRSAAPLAQCAPRLMGESNTGSCRTHTPFSTTASTAQPTEQWPQTVRLTSTLRALSSLGASAASALRTSVSWVAANPAPTPRPERRRNARRSMVGIARDTPRARPDTSEEDDAALLASVDLRVNSMMAPRAAAQPGLKLGWFRSSAGRAASLDTRPTHRGRAWAWWLLPPWWAPPAAPWLRGQRRQQRRHREADLAAAWWRFRRPVGAALPRLNPSNRHRTTS